MANRAKRIQMLANKNGFDNFLRNGKIMVRPKRTRLARIRSGPFLTRKGSTLSSGRKLLKYPTF